MHSSTAAAEKQELVTITFTRFGEIAHTRWRSARPNKALLKCVISDPEATSRPGLTLLWQ